MHSIQVAAGQIIASDTQASADAVDTAVVSLAHLCANIVEVSKASKLPIMVAQGALEKTGEGLAKLIASRADMSAATRELNEIQRRSNLRETSFGCPPLNGSLAPADGKRLVQDA